MYEEMDQELERSAVFLKEIGREVKLKSKADRRHCGSRISS
jgi:hypothetical protein